MGADLILAFCPVPSYDDGTVIKRKDEKRVRKEFIERVRALTPEQIASALEDVYPGDPDDSEDGVERFIAAYDEVFMSDGSRDVVDLCIGGRWYIFSGGMSWGDTPTDSYDSVNLLSCFDLLEKPFGPAPS